MNRRKLFALLGAASVAPLLPKAALASGGVVPAGVPYLVGERGPEAILASSINSADGSCYWDLNSGTLNLEVIHFR